MADDLRFDVPEGDDHVQGLTVTNGDGSPYDLTGADVEFIAKAAASETDLEARVRRTSNPADGLTVAAPATAGKVTVDLPASLALTAGTYLWRLVEVRAGRRRTLLDGTMHVTHT